MQRRKHAKRKAAHILKLIGAGSYDPLRPVAPDPERWVPKKLRSTFRRRRKRAEGALRGGQGAGTGAGSLKDAAKLDAYARAQAKKQAEAKAAEEAASGKRVPWRRLK